MIISSILLIIIVVATIAFILYDSGKKRSQEPTLDGHHAAGPGTLGHPEGCEHLMTPEQREEFDSLMLNAHLMSSEEYKQAEEGLDASIDRSRCAE